ncbi:hypothetical protein HZC53_04455 [Candidatus Uhrbacteria bacterium]|nr:hypothetical protein [Candidatus Uhrbacteria bacterium]
MLNRIILLLAILAMISGCSSDPGPEDPKADETQEAIQLDPQTGIPYATTYQFPIQGFNASDFGFGFGSMNNLICMARDSNGTCVAYGYHLAHDSQVGRTPYGKEVLAPADGIVRITTDITFQGYGSTNRLNSSYYGCAVVLEHEFANGDRFTSLLGHVQCESVTGYDPAARIGNPARGTVVRRGQYVGHIGHYWYGSAKTVDWHHIHWGLKKGAFSPAAYTRTGLRPWVRGYAARSEFSKDPQTGKMTHAEWVDPIDIVKMLGDPALTPDVGVRHHPPGSMLEDEQGAFWLVTGEAVAARLPTDVLTADHYDTSLAARVSQDELDCYAHASDIATLGKVTLYKRPGSNTVVMAYDDRKERYDVIRQEALYSWGYNFQGLTTDAAKIQKCETTYTPRGYRLLRPGTLVKADEESEVSIVTPWQTRRAIGTGEIFEKLGYNWDRVMSVPYDVISSVAGVREAVIVDYDSIFACALPAPCPSEGTCGGGDDPEDYDDGTDDPEAGSEPEANNGQVQTDAGVQPETAPAAETCNGLDDDGNGLIDEIFLCRLGATDGPPCVSSCGSVGQQVCDAPTCSWGTCRPKAENCANTIDDDCNGLVDCADPVCQGTVECQPEPDAGQSDGGTPEASTPEAGNGMSLLRLIYNGPAAPGAIKLFAWWQPPSGPARSWAQVTECVDTLLGDGKLDCVFSVQSGTSPLEFQINLPDGRFWGDQNCSSGGCGSTVGTVSLDGPNGPLTVTLVPNNPNGQPYFNGHVQNVP